MYYRLKYGKNYGLKIAVLVLAAVLGELLIWWGMVREESADWLVSQVTHIPWSYAITEMEDGRTVIGNVVQGFEVTLPPLWQIKKLKHPSFYLSEGEELVCEIKSDVIKHNGKIGVRELLKEQENFIMTYVGGLPAIKKEQTTSEENFIYELQIPIEKNVIEYTLFASKTNKYKCQQEFDKIRRSWLYYE